MKKLLVILLKLIAVLFVVGALAVFAIIIKYRLELPNIQSMVEEDRYCVDILVQISAIQSALKNVGLAVTERHVKHCVTDAIQNGEGEEMIDELMSVLKQFSK